MQVFGVFTILWYARGVDTLVGFAVEVLRLVPLVIAFYVCALVGVAIYKERGESYAVKSTLVLALGFGLILAFRFLGATGSAAELSLAAIVSLLQIAAALALAALTVYKLAD